MAPNKKTAEFSESDHAVLAHARQDYEEYQHRAWLKALLVRIAKWVVGVIMAVAALPEAIGKITDAVSKLWRLIT